MKHKYYILSVIIGVLCKIYDDIYDNNLYSFLGIPKELIEAARVDGLSWFGVFWRICLPLSIPVTLGAGLLLFVFQWESYLWPLIAAPSPELHLIQVTLGRFSTEYEMVWNQQFAASSIAGFLPLVFIYMFQKQFVSALTGVEQK